MNVESDFGHVYSFLAAEDTGRAALTLTEVPTHTELPRFIEGPKRPLICFQRSHVKGTRINLVKDVRRVGIVLDPRTVALCSWGRWWWNRRLARRWIRGSTKRWVRRWTRRWTWMASEDPLVVSRPTGSWRRRGAQDGCSVPAEASNSVHAGLAPVPADSFPTGRRTIPTREPSHPVPTPSYLL